MRRISVPGYVIFAAIAASPVSWSDESNALDQDTEQHRIDFDTEILPILTRQGCNAGSCHGAAIGRGGFKLSLLGSNAAVDYQTIVNELEGRRVNLANPDESLLLRKPSEEIGHEGGLALPPTSLAFETIQRWITEGAPRGARRRLLDVLVTPQAVRLDGPGQSVDVQVHADFGDARPIDVTAWTLFQADDPDAVSVADNGRSFVVHERGVHIVVGRFLDRVLPIRLTVPMHDQPNTQWKSIPRKNQIDDFINVQLRRLNLPASPAADDWTMVRRITLDLTGRLPTANEARDYVQDASPDKQDRLVHHLLQTQEFADYWALKYANELGIDSKQLQPEGAAAYHHWLTDRFRDNAPADQTARMMLTSIGDGYVDGPVNFFRSGSSPGDLAERTGRIFMGVRLQCANCHDHPLDHWKQDDYHGLAAIFAKVKRGRVVTLSERGEVTHPVTGQPAVPRIPGDSYLETSIENGTVMDQRAALAKWMTSKRNPYFAKAIVNRLWRHLMGRGLVDPVDDLRATNPATHPELLQWLADDFVEGGFRLSRTIELICSSSAYARESKSTVDNEMDKAYYSHALVKPLEAEVVADAISDVTGVPLRADGTILASAVRLTDNRMAIPSLDVLGRCDRQESCGGTSDASASLARSLHLINGDLINTRVASPEGRLHKLLATNTDNAEVLDEIHLWTLTSPPVSGSEYWREQLASLSDASRKRRQEFFEDVMWSLMTSEAFATNH